MRLFEIMAIPLAWLRDWRRKPARGGADAAIRATPALLPPAPRPVLGPSFRIQLCCHTGRAVSVQAYAPDHLAGDADALLRLGLRQLRRWDAEGLLVPRLVIELPVELAQSETMAQPLIWEIDRQEVAVDRLIFCAPPECGRGRNLSGLKLLARHGCGIELGSFDPEDLLMLHDLSPQGARLRVPQNVLRNCHADPSSGQVVLSLLALAERYDLTTLGDGVRSREEHGFLAQLGCSVVQGDAVAPLLDANGTTHFLREIADQHARPVLVPRPAA